MRRSQLHIATPCQVDWSTMDGDAQTRFCGQCEKHVHDLSAMTQRQAETLLKKDSSPCVRYTSDPDGRIHFRPERPVVLARAGLLVAGLLIAGLPAEASTTPDTPPSDEEWTLIDWISERVWPQDDPVETGVKSGTANPPHKEADVSEPLMTMGVVFYNAPPEPKTDTK